MPYKGAVWFRFQAVFNGRFSVFLFFHLFFLQGCIRFQGFGLWHVGFGFAAALNFESSGSMLGLSGLGV